MLVVLPFLILALAYAAVLGAYFFWWKRLEPFENPTPTPPPRGGAFQSAGIENPEGSKIYSREKPLPFGEGLGWGFSGEGLKISVIIPARNEAENIPDCLASIFENDFPPELFEVIVVDDFSDDETAQLVQNQRVANLRLIKMSEKARAEPPGFAFKKQALSAGIEAAKGEIIVTTDADCLAPKSWLRLISAFFAQRPETKILAAPVGFFDEKSSLERFQSLDFLGFMAITGAGIAGRFQRMGNGANLAFRRAAFDEIGGYAGIDGLASGDDMLLLQKMARRWPDGPAFLKSPAALVRTRAKPTWAGFFSQRIRWASKSAAYPERLVTAILAVVWLFCSSLLVSAGLFAVLGGKWAAVFAFQLLTKAAADWLFLREAAAFFGRRDLLKTFWPSFFWHVWYIVAVGTASLFLKKYEWKGRRVR